MASRGAAWSDQVHAVLKSDLAGAQVPSGPLGANAARSKRRPADDATLAHNLNAVMKKLVPGWRWLARNMTVPPSTRRAQELVPRTARTENRCDHGRTRPAAAPKSQPPKALSGRLKQQIA